MIFLVAAFLILGAFVGTAAHLPLPVTAAAATVIGAWLLIFAIRERRQRQRS